MHEQLVLVGARVQADVADGEERGLELVLELAGRLHHREVQAGLLQFGDVLHRQVGQHAFVALAAEHEAVDVDRLGELVERHLVVVVAAQLPAALASAALVLGEELGQRGVGHAQEFDVDFLDIHRYHRQAAALPRRQHAALRGEADRGVQFAGEHLLLDVAAEHCSVGGGQFAGDAHGVGGIGLDEREAQRLAVVIERPAALVDGAGCEGEELVEVLGADQRPRELECQGQRVLALVGIGARQAEALDLLALGLDRLAADGRQLPLLAALAGWYQRNQSQQQNHHPLGAHAASALRLRCLAHRASPDSIRV